MMPKTKRDIYQEELERAMREATYIPNVKQYMIPSFRLVGIVQTASGKHYYYHSAQENRYYTERDFDIEMREAVRRYRFQQRK